MSAIGFDTLKFARKLKEAGVPDKQAEAQAEVLGEAFLYNLDEIVTRDYLDARLAPINARLDGIDARLDGIDTRLDAIDARLNQMAHGFTEIDGKFLITAFVHVNSLQRLAGLARRL